MKYSLIVPLYNRQDTIKNCIESLLVQEETDYEIIIVDDGSTDNSGILADEYALKYPFIKVIHKENGGANLARECGLKQAVGEYVLFPDSDDEYKPNLLSFLNEYYGYDVITFGHEVVYQAKIEEKKIVNNNISTDEVTKQEALIFIEEKGALNVPWNKAYKRDIIKDIKFVNMQTAEDLLLNCKYFLKVNTIAIISNVLYKYIRKEDVSLATKYNANILSDIAASQQARMDLYENYNIARLENVIKMFAKKQVGYTFSVVPNIYRKGNGLSFKQKYNQIKQIVKDKDLKKYLKQGSLSGFNGKTFSLLVKLNNGVIAHITYSFLFFIRNNFTKLYKKLRRN